MLLIFESFSHMHVIFLSSMHISICTLIAELSSKLSFNKVQVTRNPAFHYCIDYLIYIHLLKVRWKIGLFSTKEHFYTYRTSLTDYVWAVLCFSKGSYLSQLDHRLASKAVKSVNQAVNDAWLLIKSQSVGSNRKSLLGTNYKISMYSFNLYLSHLVNNILFP